MNLQTTESVPGHYSDGRYLIFDFIPNPMPNPNPFWALGAYLSE